MAPTGLPDRDHQARLQFVDGGADGVDGRAEDARQLARMHHEIRLAPAVERAHRFPRWVDGLAVNGSKPVSNTVFILVLYRYIKKYSSAMFTTSSGSAVGICALITPFLSGSSSRAAGTMLKLAAIGVIKVPQ